MKLSGKLPEDHGLTGLAPRMTMDPLTPRYALVELDCIRVTTDTATGEQVPTARIRRVEAVLNQPLVEHVRGLLDAAHDVRLGITPLFDHVRDRSEDGYDLFADAKKAAANDRDDE